MSQKITKAPFVQHEYDIELNALTNKVYSVVQNKKFWPKDGRTAEDYSLSFAVILKEYCDSENSDLTSPIQIINPNANFYGTFLAFSLCFVDVPRIGTFLDYQRSFFKGNYYAPPENFTGLVEFMVYQKVHNISVKSTTERLKAIMSWVRETKKEIRLLGMVPKPLKKSFRWTRDPSELRIISNLIFKKGYTKTKVSFNNVFEDKVPAIWLKDTKVLAYLIDELYKRKLIVINEGGKGHFIASQNFFCNYLKETLSASLLKFNNHEVRIRFHEKNSDIRKTVDEWLKIVAPIKAIIS